MTPENKEFHYTAMFERKNITDAELSEKFKDYIESKKETLDPELVDSLNESFIDDFRATLERARHEKGEGVFEDEQFIGNAMTDALSRLDALLKRAEEEPRLNPLLETKPGMQEKFIETLKEIKGDKNIIAVLVHIDLDDFKIVNDKYAHLVGDSVLKAAGRALREVVRKDDVAAHYSGDEFALLFKFNKDQIVKELEKTSAKFRFFKPIMQTRMINEKIEQLVKEKIKHIQEKMPTYIAENEYEAGRIKDVNADGEPIETRPELLKQELSVGYRTITSKDVANQDSFSEHDFEAFHIQADQALSDSKLAKCVNIVLKKEEKSHRRAVSFDNVGVIEGKYPAKVIEKAKAFRDLKRGLKTSFPNIPDEILVDRIFAFIDTMSKLDEQSSKKKKGGV